MGRAADTYHAPFPDHAHSILHAAHAMWDLGEVFLAHGFLLRGEWPVI